MRPLPLHYRLIAGQLKRLNTAIDAKQAQRARLLDAYQAGLFDLDELTRRTSALTARHSQLVHERETLTTHSAELATQNRLRHRVADFSERIAASLNELDFDGRQRLLRLDLETVRVTGWRVEIHLKIPLPDYPPPNDAPRGHRPTRPDRPKPGPTNPRALSSDTRLRSVHAAPGGRLHNPNDAQPEPREADVRRRATALIGHRAAGSPRTRSRWPGWPDDRIRVSARERRAPEGRPRARRTLGPRGSHRGKRPARPGSRILVTDRQCSRRRRDARCCRIGPGALLRPSPP